MSNVCVFLCACICVRVPKRNMVHAALGRHLNSHWLAPPLIPPPSPPASPPCCCKPLPPESANSSCSLLFIMPLSLKEPYPEHGESHSSHSPCLPLSLTHGAVPPLPLSSRSLSLSLPRFTSPSLSPPHLSFPLPSSSSSPPLSPCLFSLSSTLRLERRLTHLVQQGGPLLSGGVCFGELALKVPRVSFRGDGHSALPSPPRSSTVPSSDWWNAKPGLMDVSELCTPESRSYQNQ